MRLLKASAAAKFAQTTLASRPATSRRSAPPAGHVSVHGVVKRVVYASEESSYKIVRMKVIMRPRNQIWLLWCVLYNTSDWIGLMGPAAVHGTVA
jgi:hypothetical protein